MKKDIMAKAIRLADKSKARPEKVVIAKPSSAKPVAELRSERLYTRLTPAEMKQLNKRVGKMLRISDYLRDLIFRDLDANNRKHGR